MKEKQIIVVAGPTASGKSDFAVELALKHKGEIISADSRQVYKGLDIGTGKITKAEMKGIPHYMLDVLDANQEFSVAEYKKIALPILEDILARDKTPIICGGTGQYIDALIFTSEVPKVLPNTTLRKELEARTVESLYEELATKDRRRADMIDKKNKVRLIRALEVVASLGEVPELTPQKLRYPTTFYLLQPSRSVSRERTERRLLKRIEGGMLEECKKLLTEGADPVWLEKLGLEYRYMSRHLRGEITYEEFVEILRHKTFQYAKRQDTWNKKYLPIATIVEVK